MTVPRLAAALLLALAACPSATAGLYYSGEEFAELPSQWRGFLPDHRALRQIARPTTADGLPNPLREQYRDAALRLEEQAKARPLSAGERADLGALYVRLGRADDAVALLRAARRDHPDDHALAANLGTAWQLAGDLRRSAAELRDAVRLAPEKLRPAEELHLRLVRLRAAEPADSTGLDDLFGVRFSDGEKYEAGRLAEAERKRLPTDALARLQRLALWLPADGRLLWQLGELANASGDVRTAAAILDGCVTELGLSDAELRRHRQVLRSAADELAKLPADHDAHKTGPAMRSARPLVPRLELASLPPVRPDGTNPLPWAVTAQTTIDRRAKPTFHKRMADLEGKKVRLTGFLAPVGDEAESGAFLLVEYPVGCWFCEAPDTTGIFLVELPAGKAATLKRGLVKVEGRLALNRDDPEDFLYSLRDARFGEPD
jgi:tetratricopeptide (TPR) repeat protein